MELQITILSEKYKPISTLVQMPMKEIVAKNFKPYVEKGIIKICQKKRWLSSDIKKYGYTKVMHRIYDREKIEKENAERYEKIKKERGWA